jgi:dienelactone hydrolase
MLFRALEVVAKDPRVDPARIAVMGFSQGGSAALYSSMARFQNMYGAAGLQFVGHISAYGACATRYRDDEDVTKPILLLHGTADDLALIAPCREYAERLSKTARARVRNGFPSEKRDRERRICDRGDVLGSGGALT